MRALGRSDPTHIASYRLLGLLGGGGMGRVYLGQSRAGRRLVIKVLNEEYAEDPEYRQRFSREVAAAKLVSPLFTAAVIDADPVAASPWLATTFIDGPSLEDSVRKNGKLAPSTVMTLAAGLAEALASIHGVGLVHRDLKPSNVLIDANGPRIIDFGIALSGDETRITTSLMVGTPSFMAPERLNGLDAGPAGDMFSLGATLYYAATGTPLVRGGTFYEQVTQVALGRFDLDALPPECRPIIERCLSSEPQKRPTAAELAQILEDLGVSQPINGWWPDPISSVATLDSAKERRRQLTRRRVLMGAGAVGVVLAGSGAALWRSRQQGASPIVPPPSATPSAQPRPVGRMLWHVHSGADPRPGAPVEANATKVIVDRGARIICTNAETVFANDTNRRRLWTEVLPTSSPRLWQWGDFVLAGDQRRLWLLDAATGAQRFEIDPVTAEEAKTQDNPDRMTVQIQWVFPAGDRALVGLGTATIAIDLDGIVRWRRPRQFDPQGRRTPPPTPMAANDTHVLTKESGGTPRVGMRQMDDGDLVWQDTDTFSTESIPGNGPGGKPDALWSLMEGRFGEGFVVLRAGSQVQVRSLSNGRLRWHNTSPTPVVGVELIGGLVLMAADRITARQATNGDFAWDETMRGGRLAIHPAGDSVLVAHDEGLSRLDLKGAEMWREPYPDVVKDSMPERISVDDKAVYVTFRAREDDRGPGPGGGGQGGPKPSQGPNPPGPDGPPSDVVAFRYS